MKKSSKTRASLLSSVISLTLCFAMLLGTTFAWFTDTASTGVNKIQAGTLDIQLLAEDGTTSLEEQPLEFQKAAGATETDVLWEPGATYYTQGFQIKNGGNLYLKFNLIVNGISGGNAKLLNAIDFYITTEKPTSAQMPDSGVFSLNDFSSQAYTLAPGKYFASTEEGNEGSDTATTLYLVGHMHEDAGNEYQGLTIEGVGITINATQKDAESDSFNNQYDVTATIPLSSSVNGNLDVTTTEDASGNVTSVSVTEAQTIADSTMSVTYPANVALKPSTEVEGETEKKASVDQKLKYIGNTLSEEASNHNVTLEDDQAAAHYELTLPVADTNTTVLVPVTINYTANLSGVKVYHNGTELPEGVKTDAEYFTYNAATGALVLGLFHASPIDIVFDTPVASIGTAMYGSLADAVAAAKDGDTIKLLKSVEGAGVVVHTDKYPASGLTIDLNGNTYTVINPTVGSPATETNGFQLLKGGKLTFKNGTLVAGTDSAKILIQNYCDLTVTNVDLKANANTQYVVSNNNGNTVFNGSTSIIAAEGWYAFDAYYWPTGGYGTVTVTVDTTGTITGNIDKSTDGTALKDGEKHEIIIKSGTFSVDPKEYVVEGYTTKLNDEGMYIIAEAVNSTEKIEELIAAGEPVTVDSDVDKTFTDSSTFNPEKTISVPENKTAIIDFANNRLDIISNSGANGIIVNKGATATFSNGTISMNKSYGSSYPVIKAEASEITLDNMTVELTDTSGNCVSAGSDGGKVIIKNSTVKGPDSKYSNAVYTGSQSTLEFEGATVIGGIRVENNGNLIIKSGDFRQATFYFGGSSGKRTVYAGTFAANPKTLGLQIDTNSTVTDNGDGTWTVTAAQ